MGVMMKKENNVCCEVGGKSICGREKESLKQVEEEKGHAKQQKQREQLSLTYKLCNNSITIFIMVITPAHSNLQFTLECSSRHDASGSHC